MAYRDFKYVIPFLVQLWMFATPRSTCSPRGRPRLQVPFPAPEPGLRPDRQLPAAVLGGPLDCYALAVSVPVRVAMLSVAGAFYFRRVERGFADII